MAEPEISAALARLDALTRRLRAECPWDREQDARSIVPHTVEEAYELADAAHRGDDAKLLDELGDVLFQVCFLALLLEERDAGDLAQVAEHCRQKLIRRHPHVFADADVASAAEVLRNWDAIKAQEPDREPGIFGEVPENLPALLYARKLQRRAASAGASPSHDGAQEGLQRSVATLRGELAQLEAAIDAETPPAGQTAVAPAGRHGVAHEAVADDATIAGADPASAGVDSASIGVAAGESARPGSFEELGDVLFAVVALARELKLDPELALRAAAERFREKIGEHEQ